MSPDRVVKAHPAPRFLKVFVYLSLLAGLVSLPVAVTTAFNQNHLQDQRNADRVAVDQASCQRGNDFRQQVKDIATAQKTLYQETIQASLPTDPALLANPRVAAFVAKVHTLLDDYQKAVDRIQLTDCAKAVPTGK